MLKAMLPFAILLVPALLAAQPRPVPIDNAYVKVIDALDKPHAKGALHDHKVNRVMIYLDKCDTIIAEPGGKVERQHWKPGDVAWSPARGMHTSENPNDTACRIIEIELKPGEGRKPVAAGALDPVKVDPARYKVLFENDQVRVLRAKYAAHDTGAMHEHLRDRVTVPLTNSELKVTTPDGKTEVRHMERGMAAWGGVVKHQEYNASDHPFEVIAVELKSR
jgi:hypothetical protein